MENNIFPKSVFTGKNADGAKFTIFEYDYGSYTNLTILNSFYGIFIFSILGSVASPLVYLLGLITYRATFNFLFLISFIISGYAAYDIWNDWILFKCLAIFFPDSFLLFLFKVNFAVSISSLVLMITPAIVKAFNSFYVYIFVVIFSFYIGYQLANSYNADKPDWVKINQAPDVDPIDLMSTEEYIKYQNDKYEQEVKERKERERIK